MIDPNKVTAVLLKERADFIEIRQGSFQVEHPVTYNTFARAFESQAGPRTVYFASRWGGTTYSVDSAAIRRLRVAE